MFVTQKVNTSLIANVNHVEKMPSTQQKKRNVFAQQDSSLLVENAQYVILEQDITEQTVSAT